MATLTTIGNLVNCGSGTALGTGGKGCIEQLKATTSIWFTPADFVFDATVDFDQDYIAQLQAEGNLIILDGVKEFTVNKEENVFETDADGGMTLVRKGLYAFNAMFKKGFSYNAALSSLDSLGIYDTLFVDSDSNILGTTSSTDSLKGMSTGYIDAQGVDFATFSTSMKQGISFQFTDNTEIDDTYYFVSNGELDWKPAKQSGVNEVVLSYVAVPANAGVAITVKAKLKQGGGVFTGAVFGDFNLKVDGVTSNPTAGDDSITAGTYILTVAAVSTNEVLTIDLYDNTNSREGITIDGDIYKSAAISATAV